MPGKQPLKKIRIPLIALIASALFGGAILFSYVRSHAEPPAPAPLAEEAAPPGAPVTPLPATPGAPLADTAKNTPATVVSPRLIADRTLHSLVRSQQAHSPAPSSPTAPADSEVNALGGEPPATPSSPAFKEAHLAAHSPVSHPQNTAPDPLTPPGTIFALGVGIDHLPRWQGSAKTENRPLPYIDINWRDQVEFSTVKGLVIDLLNGEQWHGGIIGTLVWGRSTKDLAGLRVPTLRNTVQGGLYLEYSPTPQTTLGVRLRHDLQNTGVAYGEVYGEMELPKVGYLEHDLRISVEGMNQKGMRRFFGLSSRDAAQLGISAYQPNAAASKTSLTYEGFMPTSASTGIVFGATIGRLSTAAGNSPLVRNFGSRQQKEVVAAFVYHF